MAWPGRWLQAFSMQVPDTRALEVALVAARAAVDGDDSLADQATPGPLSPYPSLADACARENKHGVMLDKLAQVEARYEELNRKLSEPDLAQDAQRMRALGKEHRQLQGLMEALRQLRAVQGQLVEARVLAQEGGDAELMAMAQDELTLLLQQEAQHEQALLLQLMPRDPNDDKNVILELRSGTGGDEASLFCGELFRLYSRLGEARGWRLGLLSASPGTHGGFKEVIALVEGDEVYSTLKFESGVHRVQRVPATETQGRITPRR